jgi:hypothetical protein
MRAPRRRRCEKMWRMKNRTSRQSPLTPEWGIVVRLNDGTRLFYSSARDATGQADWTPRLNEAERFASEAEAIQTAAPMQTNRSAMEYEVVRLPQQ